MFEEISRWISSGCQRSSLCRRSEGFRARGTLPIPGSTAKAAISQWRRFCIELNARRWMPEILIRCNYRNLKAGSSLALDLSGKPPPACAVIPHPPQGDVEAKLSSTGSCGLLEHVGQRVPWPMPVSRLLHGRWEWMPHPRHATAALGRGVQPELGVRPLCRLAPGPPLFLWQPPRGGC